MTPVARAQAPRAPGQVVEELSGVTLELGGLEPRERHGYSAVLGLVGHQDSFRRVGVQLIDVTREIVLIDRRATCQAGRKQKPERDRAARPAAKTREPNAPSHPGPGTP